MASWEVPSARFFCPVILRPLCSKGTELTFLTRLLISRCVIYITIHNSAGNEFRGVVKCWVSGQVNMHWGRDRKLGFLRARST